jgi:hypothetical protein
MASLLPIARTAHALDCRAGVADVIAQRSAQELNRRVLRVAHHVYKYRRADVGLIPQRWVHGANRRATRWALWLPLFGLAS